MFFNILSPILLGLIAALTIAIDHFWRDKRTTAYKRVRKVLIVAIFFAVISNVIVSINNEKTIKNSDDTIDNLTKQVATLENQNSILSILERMQSYISSDYRELSKKYPEGYYLFASNKYTVIPSNKGAETNFSLDWSSCKVKRITDSFLHIALKSFSYLPNNIDIQNLNIVLERKVGSVADGIFMNNIGLFVELLDEKKEEIIYVIGFRKVESIPKERKLDPRVTAFKKDAGIKGASVSAIDTNIRKYITLQDFTISSGWEIIDK